MKNPLTEQDLVASWRQLGLKPGDAVLVHSSLRSLGYVEGGADTVVSSLMAAVGPSGLLMMPTFTYSSCRFLDVLRTPSRAGAITEAFRQREGVYRSWHPTHAPAAWGRGAEEIVAEHHRREPFGRDSPIDRLAQRGGKVLLIGVTHVADSTIHVGEAHARMPYLYYPQDRPPAIPVRTPHGEIISVPIREQAGHSGQFDRLDAPLRARRAVREGLVGRARCQLLPGAEIIATTVELLARDPLVFLCSDPQCHCCQSRRKAMAEISPGEKTNHPQDLPRLPQDPS